MADNGVNLVIHWCCNNGIHVSQYEESNILVGKRFGQNAPSTRVHVPFIHL